MSRGDRKKNHCTLSLSLSICLVCGVVRLSVTRDVCLRGCVLGSAAQMPSSVRESRETECAQAAEHKELVMCPSPHIWCAGAGSGLGRRSDWPNEISQHTKCLSGPIRIPSCLP